MASRLRAATAGSGPGGHASPAVSVVESLDEVIHQKARLGIMSTLLALGEADFRLLKETLVLTDGNLSTHLTLLEQHGYVEIIKEFRGRKPHTRVRPTPEGREAFQRYLVSLERIVRTAKPDAV